MIKVSTQARNQVMQMMQSDGYDISDSFVRVGVKSGGCSGLSYELKFDKALGDDDKLFEDNDVRIVVDKKSFLYLVGTTLEYSGGLNGKGFVFNNPNANRTCGCGESFSLKKQVCYGLYRRRIKKRTGIQGVCLWVLYRHRVGYLSNRS
jgi:iron-sulfur cluster assembly protein